jgi:hypothetical protein
VPLAKLPCGNIDPLGVTGTPVIDPTSRTLFVDAMTTPDGGTTKHHLVFGLSTDDGSVRSSYPVDVEARLAATGISASYRFGLCPWSPDRRRGGESPAGGRAILTTA